MDAKFSIVARPRYNGPAMKFCCLAMIGALVASAAEMPTGYFRGPMAGWEGSLTSGVLKARGTGGEVYTCGFDAKTYLEFQKRRITVDKLQDGDPLEVLAYRKPGETACYVLSVTVVPPPVPVRPNRRIDVTPTKAAKRAIVRHGNVNVSGVVVHLDSVSVTVRTRTGEERFLLRGDTRFFGNGLRMERTDVAVNQRLAVEAGRNSEGQMEAFQLTWGDLSAR
jgi:hypothetical protein